MVTHWFSLHDGIINEMIYSSSSKAGREPVLKKGAVWVLGAVCLSTMLEDSACVCFPRLRMGSVSFVSSDLQAPSPFRSFFISVHFWLLLIRNSCSLSTGQKWVTFLVIQPVREFILLTYVTLPVKIRLEIRYFPLWERRCGVELQVSLPLPFPLLCPLHTLLFASLGCWTFAFISAGNRLVWARKDRWWDSNWVIWLHISKWQKIKKILSKWDSFSGTSDQATLVSH